MSVTPLRSRFTKVIRYHPRGTFKGPMPQWGIGGSKQEHTGEERLFQEYMWEGMVCLGDHTKILVLLEEQVWEGR